jgi:hypothetical protein
MFDSPAFERFAEKVLRPLNLVFAGLGLGLSVALVAAQAHVYHTYLSQTAANNPFWLPIWPQHFQTAGTKTAIGILTLILVLHLAFVGVYLWRKVSGLNNNESRLTIPGKVEPRHLGVGTARRLPAQRRNAIPRYDQPHSQLQNEQPRPADGHDRDVDVQVERADQRDGGRRHERQLPRAVLRNGTSLFWGEGEADAARPLACGARSA